MAEIVTIEAHGGRYRIENPGGILGRSISQGQPYERRVLEHIFRRGFEGTAVDVGASVGNHTLWLAAVCGLRVEAFEPLTYERLVANVALNPTVRVGLHDCALGSQANSAHPAGKGRLTVGSGEVRVRTLDSFGLRDVALIKIDVEGMEPDVLEGAVETLRRDRPVVYAEAWDEAAHERLSALLGPHDYRHAKSFGATPLEEWVP